MRTFLIFVGMTLVTYATRYTMMVLLGQGQGTEEPLWLQRWLRYVPPAVLAALIAPAILAPEGQVAIGCPFWVALIGGVIAWRTRSVVWTVLGGLAVFWLLRALGG